jgi:transposase-like protein
MDENKTTRRHWEAEQKLAIIEEARQTGHRVSEVCQRHRINVKQFYAWERQARRGALDSLKQGNRKPKVEAVMTGLASDLARLKEVIVELSTENLALKKGRWE